MRPDTLRSVATQGNAAAIGAAFLVAVCLGACEFASTESGDADAVASENGGSRADAAQPADAGPAPAPDAGVAAGADVGPATSPDPDLGAPAPDAGPPDAGPPDAGPPDASAAPVPAPDAGERPVVAVPEAAVGSCAGAPVVRLGGPGDDGAPALAGGDEAVGVLWTRGGDAPGVRFAKLAADGMILADARALADVAIDPSWPAALVATGDGYAAAWTEAHGEAGVVVAARLDASGTPVAPPVRLSAPDADAGAPTLVSERSGHVAVAWHEAAGGSERIALARIAPDGSVLTPPTAVVLDPAGARQPRLAAGDAGLGLVWVAPRDRDQHLMYAPLSPAGALAAEPVALATGGYAGGPGLLGLPGGPVAVWHEFRDGDSEIYLRPIGGDEVQVTRDSVRPVTPAAARASGGLALAWQEERTGLRGVWAARVSADGGRVTEVRVTCGDGEATQPALATVGDGFAAAWTEAGPDGREVVVSFGRLPPP
jgi:hypothetical protein